MKSFLPRSHAVFVVSKLLQMMYIRKNYNPKTIHARRTMAISALAGPITVLIVVAIHMAGPLQATPLPTDSNRFGIDFKRYCNHHLSEMLVRVCDPNYRKGFSRECKFLKFSCMFCRR